MDYTKYNRQIGWIADQIVEWSKENSAGMPMTNTQIYQLVRDVEEYWGGGWEASDEQIEEFMENLSEGEGFLVQARDVKSAFIQYEKKFNQK